MPTDISLVRRCRDQEIAIARLIDENADLHAQLEAVRPALCIAPEIGRLEATLTVDPHAPVTARTTLTRWLSGHVPLGVLHDARLLASELVTDSVLRPDVSEDDLLRLAVELRETALRVEVRAPGSSGEVDSDEPEGGRDGGLVLHLVDQIASRWGVNRTAGIQVWFEVDSAVAHGLG